MKTLLLSVPLIWLCLAGVALAQNADTSEPRVARYDQQLVMPSLENVSPSAAVDVWMYEQQWRRYDDPKMAVRRNAEFKAAQRIYRIEAMRWFGFCNSRPSVSPVPFMGVYAPVWVSSHEDPFRWVGGGAPSVAIQIYDSKSDKQ